MKYIYLTPLPEAAQPTERTRLATQLSELGILDGGAAVESVSGQAADLTLEGQFRWGPTVSEMVAKELDELADASVGALPLYAREGDLDAAGYYEVQRADVEPLHTNRRDAYEYTLSLTFVGTRGNRRRAVRTAPSGDIDHPFGNDDRALVGVPAAADGVQWFDAATRTTADAPIVTTRSGEHGDVALVDAQSAPTDDPTLVYDAEYGRADGRVDVVCWDDRGHLNRTDQDGIRQWRRVTAPQHDYSGALVLSNGLVRLRVNAADRSLTAERWDDANTTWTDQPLGASDWELVDADVRALGLAQVRARMEFADPTASPAESCALDCWLARGYEDPLWSETGDPMPAGLVDLLEPIASDQIYEPGATKGLVDRKEVL